MRKKSSAQKDKKKLFVQKYSAASKKTILNHKKESA